jgi:cation/acetate symporter
MSLNTSYPSVNPRLGTSFGIFTSAFASLVLLLVILEQLGLERELISELIIGLPVLFYAGIGLMVRTSNVEEFFISGQRVPPLYNGFALSANLVGGAGLLGAIGAFFFIGYDAMPIILGWCAGLGLLSVLFAPYLRKAGAYTMPGYFGIRFSSRFLRLVSALILLVPGLMLLAAELSVGRMVAGIFMPSQQGILLEIGLFVIIATVFFGGMRSLTWTQCAQFIVVILGLVVPLIAISLLVTNLPVPQLSYGGILDDMGQLEVARGLTARGTRPLSEVLPGADPAVLARPFTDLFGAVSAADYISLTLCIMLGTAVLPSQIARLSTTPTVSGVRKSFGWAALIIGLIALTIPAYAAFTKFQVLQQLLGQPLAQVPEWGRLLEQLGLVTLSSNQLDPALGAARVQFSRDSVALIMPVLNSFPFVLIGVIGAAAIAAVFAAAAGQLVAMANVLSNDIYYPLVNRSASPSRRLLVARLSMIGLGIVALWLATRSGFDPLRMVIWAFSLCAGGFFAVLALSIWWRGLTSFGAIVGMLSGFGATAAYILLTASGGFPWFGVDGLAAGMLGIPVSLLGAFTGSMLSPRPDQQSLDLIDEMRVPSGETIHARLLRLAARGKVPKP